MKFSCSRARVALPLALVVAGVAAPAASAAPVGVDVRVEGRTQTFFDAEVTTDGHDVTTASTGTHKCDGTNGGTNPTPGPTPTAALDDAARLGGFSWDGDWYDSFEDFLIDRVGTDTGDFWGVFVNGVQPSVGGCQFRIRQGDEVLWANDAFNKVRALRLAGAGNVTVGSPLAVRVTNWRGGAPVSGATVRGARTGSDGRATLSFDKVGVYRLKAEEPQSVRSNSLVVCVDRPGATPCSSADAVAPTVSLLLRSGLASSLGMSRTFTLSWQAADPGNGSGVARYVVEGREERGSSADGWDTVATTTAPTTRFRGAPGRTYGLKVSAIDRAGNRSVASRRRIVVPVDDRDRRLLRFAGGWKRLKRDAAWGGAVMRSRRKGATAKFTFEGRRAVIVGRKLARGGRVRVSFGSWRKVVRLRGRGRHRQVLLRTPLLGTKRRTLTVRSLSRRPIEIDAVAPIR